MPAADTCGAGIVPGSIALVDSYYRSAALGDGGYVYAFSDQMGSTACVDSTALCAKGTTGAASATIWGSGIGAHINQLQSFNGSDPPVGMYAVYGTGVTYTVDQLPAQGLRLAIDEAGIEYCALLNATSGTVPWSEFNTQCWDKQGQSLTGPPSAATFLAIHVPAIGVASTFEFCVSSLEFSNDTSPGSAGGPGASMAGSGSGGGSSSGTSCSGTPHVCAYHVTDADCTSSGCRWASACMGSPEPCSGLGEGSCEGQEGCSWDFNDFGSCTGSPAACSEVSDCSRQEGCREQAVCQGTPTACVTHAASARDCNAAGCQPS